MSRGGDPQGGNFHLWVGGLATASAGGGILLKQDAKQGVQVAQVLEGFISRKVVKQTVMTVVYGVTRYGGRLQIERGASGA